MKTLVLGGSLKPNRYSYKAIESLRGHGYAVVSIGKKEGMVLDVKVQESLYSENDIHTVTVYLSAENQKNYEAYILSLKPKRIIFNPGTENISLYESAVSQGIEVMNACTLVLLSINKY